MELATRVAMVLLQAFFKKIIKFVISVPMALFQALFCDLLALF